jgi:hypothetical protein
MSSNLVVLGSSGTWVSERAVRSFLKRREKQNEGDAKCRQAD